MRSPESRAKSPFQRATHRVQITSSARTIRSSTQLALVTAAFFCLPPCGGAGGIPESWLGVDIEGIFEADGLLSLHGAPLTKPCLEDTEDGHYAARRASLVSACARFGDVCDLGVDHRPLDDPLRGSPWSGVSKRVNCAEVWADSTDEREEGPHEWPPPALPPCPLARDFTMGGRARLRHWHFVERHIEPTPVTTASLDSGASPGPEGSSGVWPRGLIDELAGAASRGLLHERFGSAAGSAGDPFSKLAAGLAFLNVTGRSVLVIGSTSPWAEAVALSAGARRVTTLEYRPIECDHPQVETLTVSELRDRYLTAAAEEGRLPEFDVVVSHSSLEHSGLGRYGDPLDPWADLATMARAWCVATPKTGQLLLGVPYLDPAPGEAPGDDGGQGNENAAYGDQFVYNAHRIYSSARFPHLVANWGELEGWDAPPDPQKFRAFRRLDAPGSEEPGTAEPGTGGAAASASAAGRGHFGGQIGARGNEAAEGGAAMGEAGAVVALRAELASLREDLLGELGGLRRELGELLAVLETKS